MSGQASTWDGNTRSVHLLHPDWEGRSRCQNEVFEGEQAWEWIKKVRDLQYQPVIDRVYVINSNPSIGIAKSTLFPVQGEI
jgi:hypothetical protein